jgi:hypothetical protein
MPRRAITAFGVVQGVGLRAFVHSQAIRHDSAGATFAIYQDSRLPSRCRVSKRSAGLSAASVTLLFARELRGKRPKRQIS